ncbi:hypothetical protein [Hellea balneolensis]|uniref:hypothetical protein n=1 Tax=Hellea balneolensis TaxID=287478 RepID=UPI000426781E|nr:hypothetical protein [Hellea balneolensis]
MAEQDYNIEDIWDQLAKEFRNWNGVKPRRQWFKTGLSERSGYNRLRILEGGKQAKRYFSLTKNLSRKDLSYLYRRAEVNYEQAVAAARVATILNLTILVGALMLFNQIFPGLIAKYATAFFQTGNGYDLLFGLFIALLFFGVITGVLSYSHGGTTQARDLKHLLDLSLARRDLGERKLTAEDSADVGADLRENYISDI